MPAAETFTIVPAGTRPLWVLVLPLLVGLALLVVFGMAWYGSQRATFEVSPLGLRLRGDFYGRLIPPSQLRGGAARVLDMRATPQYRPTRRTLGTGLPGYAAGWYRLASGEKALLFVTDWSHVVYVPTRSGYAVLLSPTEPQALVAALQRIAPDS
ncbi:MAG TPA: PH domain-containing protein [Gemmatimonadales bacterium]|nr:PH domain-containing protein [Gemmatimonadales bacterium]